MPPVIANTQFNNFVQFATDSIGQRHSTAVAKAGEGDALAARSVSASTADKVHKFSRSEKMVSSNNATRALFRQSVIDLFGGSMDKVPESVKKAMLLDDYGKGKPLTARRIMAVKQAVEQVQTQSFEPAFAKVKTALQADGFYDSYPDAGAPGAETKAMVDELVATALKSCMHDKDALDIVSKNMERLLRRGDACLRSPEALTAKVDDILSNLDELRKCSKGDKAVVKAGVSLLMEFNGKSFPKGMLTEMVAAVRKCDVSDLKKLSTSSSCRSVHRAIKQYIEDSAAVGDAVNLEHRFEGADEIDIGRQFITDLLFAKCGSKTAAKFRSALEGENAAKVAKIYDDLANGQINMPAGTSSNLAMQVRTQGSVFMRAMDSIKSAALRNLGVAAADATNVRPYEDDVDFDEMGAVVMFSDLVERGKARGIVERETFANSAVSGNTQTAERARDLFRQLVGEYAFVPSDTMNFRTEKTAKAMVNWSIAAECKKFAEGHPERTTFALDRARGTPVRLPNGNMLSKDLHTAMDEIASLVTNGAKTSYAALDQKERGKANVTMALLSQDVGKTAFEAPSTALDPKGNAMQIAAMSDQDSDTRSFSVSFDPAGGIEVKFEGVQNANVLLVNQPSGKSISAMVADGTTVKAGLAVRIGGDELNRIADLDFSKFDDTAAQRVMADKSISSQPSAAVDTFDPQFKMQLSTASSYKVDIASGAGDVA